ncbi:MAG: hypothetical protein AB1805_16295 [Nitrospirota bacterium]
MKTKMQKVRMGTKIGAAVGGLAFLFFGLIPGFYFGSYGSLLVMKHLLGHSVEPSLLVRMVVAVGSVLGIVSTGSVSIVIGSILGTVGGYAVAAVTEPAAAAKPAGSEVKVR